MVLGIVGNVHVLYVYIFRMKPTSHRIFIIVLAMLDLLSCAVSMPFITADMFQRLTFTAATACKILRFFLYFFAGSSGLLLLPIAIDSVSGDQLEPKNVFTETSFGSDNKTIIVATGTGTNQDGTINILEHSLFFYKLRLYIINYCFDCSATACKILRFFLYFFVGSSGFLLVPIAVDRYLKTCRPFGEQITPARAKVLCIVVLFIGVASGWPATILYGHRNVVTPDSNITRISCYLDDKYKGNLYLVYWNGAMIFMTSAVFFSLIIFYYLIGKSIRAHAALKNKLLDHCHTSKVTVKSRIRTSNHQLMDINCKEKNKDRHVKKKHHKMNIYSVYQDPLVSKHSFTGTRFGTDKETNIDATGNEKTGGGTDQDGTIDTSDMNITIPIQKNKDGQKGCYGNKDENVTATGHFSPNVNAECNTEMKDFQRNKIHSSHCNDIKTNNEENVKNVRTETNSDIDVHNRMDQENACKRKEALRHTQRSKRTTQMFFTITILYFITFIPHLILQLITVTQDNFVASLSFTEQVVYHIVVFCSFLNSMVNCYVYGCFDTLFRNELKRLYTGKCIIGS
ncbi:uncharacterized protein LOC123550516 [Mercenaria mercenaria]|uniref:uncharacterized protein LOC123550516 n=1 Tax=Mercenaria mercenaria TaxID=6596 RepID=UPI00234E9356|nr:uncharacterized protein LOC123550516 [Mercenaria mercenaria]